MERRQISQIERLALKKAWGNACAYCEKPVDSFEVDHIVAYARGGSCDLENLCVTCHSCNRRKSDTPLPEFYEGLLLSLAKRKAPKIRKYFRKSQVKLPLNPLCPARAVFGNKYFKRHLKKPRGQTQYVIPEYVNDDLFKITKAGANVKRRTWLSNINEARKNFEQAATRLTGKPSQLLTERLIDLIREVRDELRKKDTQ